MFDTSRFLLLFFLFLQINIDAKEYAIVSSYSVHNLSVNKIKALFLKRSEYLGGKKIVVLNLSLGDEVRKSFEKNILKMNFSSLKSYWTRQHYLGHRPPISMKSQKSMQTFIKNVEGAIGYVELKNKESGLNILYKWRDE